MLFLNFLTFSKAKPFGLARNMKYIYIFKKKGLMRKSQRFLVFAGQKRSWQDRKAGDLGCGFLLTGYSIFCPP
jgi:hypothetical protein